MTDSSVQSLTLYLRLAYLLTIVFARARKILEGQPKREQWDGDPLEPNSVVHRERVGHYAVGGIQYIDASPTPTAFNGSPIQCFADISILIRSGGHGSRVL